LANFSGAVPQADSLERVREVVEAIATVQIHDIEALRKRTKLSDRHLHYYYEAARELGFVAGPLVKSEVTGTGRELLATAQSSVEELRVLQRAVASTAVVRQVVPNLLGPNPPTREQVATLLQGATALSQATAERRAQTLVRWRDYVSRHRADFSTRAEPEPIRLRPARTAPPRAQITSLRLLGFKGFLDAHLDMGGFTVVVGTNAGGKSNLRDAFRFLHGIARGYTLAEIIGEKWVEGGVLQWKGIRGGTREAVYDGRGDFSLEVGLRVRDGDKDRAARYFIRVVVPADGVQPPRVAEERLVIEGRGQSVFDSHPEKHAPVQDDPLHLAIRLRKGHQKGFQGRAISIINDRPALSQIPEHKEAKPKEVRDHAELALSAFQSMRFLELSSDALRLPSLPGQLVLGDRGENLSSVLQAICQDQSRKRALVEWVRELTPLDVVDFDFPQDQTGRVLLTLIEENGRRTSAHSASDGTMRFLAMIAAFLGPDPAHFYFFEELETGLHPTRLHLLLELIEEQARKGSSQVVATTHSPQLLAFLSKETVKAATLAYRLPGKPDQRLMRVLDIPEAERVLTTQDLARLHASGWLEDAVLFTADAE